MTVPDELAGLVAEAFGLDVPTRPLVPVRHVSQETWRLDTAAGSALVKRFWRGPELPWRPSLRRAMELERAALDAGIDSPAPLPPVAPQFGAAAHIPGHGIFRASPYLPHRPLDPNDDIAAWLGDTLARIQQLEPPLPRPPEPGWWYNQFPAITNERWQRWRTLAYELDRPWAGTLSARLPLILDESARIVEAFHHAAPHVHTHRDVETWNILLTPSGRGPRPVLIDWDVAGPDSAPLEAAHVLVSFATYGRTEPDPEFVRTAVTAYVEAGGRPLRPGPDLLVRLVGLELARISARMRVGLEQAELPSVDPTTVDTRIQESLEQLPALVADTAAWAELLDT